MEKIDFTYFEALSEGNEDFENEFVKTFEECYTMLIEKMKNELANSDFHNLSKSAHQLKPSIKMVNLSCINIIEDIQYHPERTTYDLIDTIHLQCGNALEQLQKRITQ